MGLTDEQMSTLRECLKDEARRWDIECTHGTSDWQEYCRGKRNAFIQAQAMLNNVLAEISNEG